MHEAAHDDTLARADPSPSLGIGGWMFRTHLNQPEPTTLHGPCDGHRSHRRALSASFRTGIMRAKHTRAHQQDTDADNDMATDINIDTDIDLVI